MDRIFLINKPIKLTSRQVCNQIGKAFKEKKVGHVGTLDPFASGLLIVSTGRCTKANAFFDESIKEYVADITLGVETDTLDNEGKVTATKEVKKYTEEEINDVLTSFLGEQQQVPPMTSAIHVNGVRLYDLAHKGIEIERPSRVINVYDIRLKNYDQTKNVITVYFKVSSGTYIRVLGGDIAKKLGNVGHLSRLVRIGVGPFKLEECSSIEDIVNKVKEGYSTSEILSRFISKVTLDDKKIEDIKNGKIKYLEINTLEDKILVVSSSDEAIAIYKRNENRKLEFVRGLF